MNATKRRLVVPGRQRRLGRPADDDEPGHGVRVVLDVGGQHLEPVVLGRDRRGDRGVVPGGPVGETGSGSRRRQRRHHGGVGQHRGQPAAALRRGVRVGGDPAYGVQAGARSHHQRERHRQQHLAGDHQRLPHRQLVERRRHRALDRVLDRHQRVVGLAAPDRVERGGDARTAAAAHRGSRPGWCAPQPRRTCRPGRGRRSGRAALLAYADPTGAAPGEISLAGRPRWPASPRARACCRSARRRATWRTSGSRTAR